MKHHTFSCIVTGHLLFLLILSLLLLSNAHADDVQATDRAKVAFQTAITKGDVQQVKQILYGLEDGISRTVVFGSQKRFASMKKLESQNKPATYEKMALFLSSINANTLYKPDWNSVTTTTTTVSGTVKDDITSQRLAGVKVIVAGRETTTDTNGFFSLTGLPEGTFDWFVIAPGFASLELTGIISADAASSRAMDFILHNTTPQKIVKGTETIDGTVVDAQTGKPIAGAKFVIAPVKADASFAKGAETDSNGHFTLTGVHVGLSELSIMPKDLLFHLPFSQKVNISGGGKIHTVVWKLERSKGEIEISAGTWVGIVLRSDTEEPIEGARIEIKKKWTVSDKDGHFSIALPDTGESLDIKDIQAMATLSAAEKRQALEKFYATMESGDTQQLDNSYLLKASHNSYSEFSETYPAKRDINKKMVIYLDPLKIGDIEGIVVDAITGKPVGLATVQVQNQSTQSKADGTFSFKKLRSGDLILQANAQRYQTAENKISLKSLDTAQIKFELQPITVGTVMGLVVNTVDQTPLAGATITAGAQTITTDAQGKFTLSDMGAGSLSIQASKPVFRAGTATVKVVAAERVNVTLKLEPITTGTVTGLALNATDHKPLAGVKITLGTRTSMTDAQGYFELQDIDAGDVLVQGSKAVFKPASQGAKVEPAKKVDVTLNLEPITVGIVTGLVVNAVDQTPLAGATITAGAQTITTDAQGKFTLSDMDAGSLSIQASKPVFRTGTAAVKVVAAESVNVTLKLDPITTGTVIGLALNAANQKPLADVKVTLGTLSVMTNTKGQFKLADVRAGDVLLMGSKEVFKPVTQSVKVLAAKNVDVTLKLEPITVGTLMGQVINAINQKPLAGATITAGSKSIITDVQGKFILSDMSVGPLSVQASKPVFKPSTAEVTVIAAEKVAVMLKLEPITTGVITGLALNAADKTPLANVKITLGTRTAMTDTQGRFELKDINVGDVMMQASKTAFKPASQGVKVVAAKNVNVTLRLEPITTASINGIVVDKNSQKPISGVRISVSNQADETDRNGRFTFKSVNIGEVQLLAQHPDYKTNTKQIQLKPGRVYEQKLELLRRREDVIELESALRAKGTVDLYGIHFDSGKDQFKPSSLPTLQAVSEVIKRASGEIFEIAGHTDSDGSDNYNLDLSKRRARTVMNWLIEHGVRSEQLKASGYGETKPIVPNNNSAGKALNRRVQLRKKGN